MLQQLFAPQLVVLYILVASTLYVHFRGRERLRIARQLGDHSTYLAPSASIASHRAFVTFASAPHPATMTGGVMQLICPTS